MSNIERLQTMNIHQAITERIDEGQQGEHHQQVSTQPEPTIDTIPAPLVTERKRHHFYDANQLRQRISASSKTLSSGMVQSQQMLYSTTTGDDGFYECNICFDMATNSVLTLCGHLFCWSCLAQWLKAQETPTCPVCKAGCGKDKVIPIYGRGQETDPRDDPSIPARPAGQRPPPLHDPNLPRSSFFGQNMRDAATYSHNVHFSGGIGFFPFGISFNIPIGGDPMDIQSRSQNGFLSRLFLMVLSLIIVAILFY